MSRDEDEVPSVPVPGLSPAGSARRRFLIDSGGIATGVAAAPYLHAADPAPGVASAVGRATAAYPLRFVVNGRSEELQLDPRVTLLDALREKLGLAGTKKGCDRGQCGACTVLVNGRRVNSCLTLALSHEGDEIVTIEGLGEPGRLHPVQAAFLVHDGFQCGYCTPGQICSAVALLAEARANRSAPLSDDAIREGMSGNLCRCGAYVNIVAAVRDAARAA